MEEQITYVMANGERSDVVKIGKSIDPERRLRALKTGAPFLRILGTLPFQEAEVHKRLDDFRLHNKTEWFYLVPTVDQYLTDYMIRYEGNQRISLAPEPLEVVITLTSEQEELVRTIVGGRRLTGHKELKHTSAKCKVVFEKLCGKSSSDKLTNLAGMRRLLVELVSQVHGQDAYDEDTICTAYMGVRKNRKLWLAAMKSPFRYPGGKSKKRIKEWILSQMPDDTLSYREPAVGGGGIFWELTGVKSRWINDIHPGLIEVYKALRDRPEAFIKKIRSLDRSTLREEFQRVKLNKRGDQAYRYFLVNRTVFAGRVNYDIPSRLYFSWEPGWNVVDTDTLDKAAQWVQGAKITCGDYKPLLTAPGERVIIYMDAPYYSDTRRSATDKLYQFSFTHDQHVKLAEDIRTCKHKVIMSYDDDPVIRGLYKGMRILTNSWKYCGTTKKEKTAGNELLIMNYG